MLGKEYYMTEKEKRDFSDRRIRRGLYEFLWKFHLDAIGSNPRPCPPMSDKQIKKELKRLIG